MVEPTEAALPSLAVVHIAENNVVMVAVVVNIGWVAEIEGRTDTEVLGAVHIAQKVVGFEHKEEVDFEHMEELVESAVDKVVEIAAYKVVEVAVDNSNFHFFVHCSFLKIQAFVPHTQPI